MAYITIGAKGANMKKTLLFVFLFTATNCYAEYVQGYSRSDGTYVQGYHRSDPDGTVTDNYSYKGNVNPYTGQEGHDYYRNSPSSAYYQQPPQEAPNNPYEDNPLQTSTPAYDQDQVQVQQQLLQSTMAKAQDSQDDDQ